MNFHSRQSLSVSFFHVSLGLPAPCLPSICISHAVLIAPQERSTCPNQQSLHSLKMRSESSSFASNLLYLTVATSSGLILQICLIMALSLPCKHCRSSWSAAKFHWHGAWPSAPRAVYMATCLVREVAGVRTGSSFLNFFQAVFTS